MSAKDHLSIQLFHGTNAPLKEGEMIVPMGDIGSPWQEDFPETGGYAHATYEPRYAEMFGERAHETFHEDFGDQSRPRVYRVEPAKDMEPDPTGRYGGWRSPSGFKVVALHSEGIPDEDAFGGFRGYEKAGK